MHSPLQKKSCLSPAQLSPNSQLPLPPLQLWATAAAASEGEAQRKRSAFLCNRQRAPHVLFRSHSALLEAARCDRSDTRLPHGSEAEAERVLEVGLVW